MNAALELHDSKVVAVVLATETVVVRLDAYVHRSQGRPGHDSGTGWTQMVELRFASGIVDMVPAELPFTLSKGSVSGGATFNGMIPLPTSVGSSVSFEAISQCGERFAVGGAGLDVVATTEAVFVELFPGTPGP